MITIGKLKRKIKTKEIALYQLEDYYDLPFHKLIKLLNLHLPYSSREIIYSLIAKKINIRNINSFGNLDKYYFFKIFLKASLNKKKIILTYLPTHRRYLITPKLIEESVKIDESHFKYFLFECDLSRYNIDIDQLNINEKTKQNMIL